MNKMALFFAGLATGLIAASFGFYYWYSQEELERQFELYSLVKAQEVITAEKANELEFDYEEEIYQLRSDYDRANAELVRLRIENAALRGGETAGAAAKCNQELAKREDLLLRMAELGIRTSEAVAEKQAALKNCVGNYAGIKAR